MASALPFIFGSLLAKKHFNVLNFILGLIAAAATHLSANLINDYADSRSGLDWQDKHFYKFFGGSKLIQEGIFKEKFYLNMAISCFAIASFCVVCLALNLKSLSIVGFYLLILLLAWSYSEKPLQLAYRGLGEVIIFMLFGPALVMGGYFIQTKIFPARETFIVSLPFGFLTTAILFANEIPDFANDKKIDKITWVNFTGEKKAFWLYGFLISLAFLSVLLSIMLGYLSFWALFSWVFILPAFKAMCILRRYPEDKMKLMESSKLTIMVQTLVSIVLILEVLL